MWDIELIGQAAKDLKRVRSAGLGEKAYRLIEALRRDPFVTQPSFGPLQGDLAGSYIRRTSLQDRLAYEVFRDLHERDGRRYEGTVRTLHMWTHYEGMERGRFGS